MKLHLPHRSFLFAATASLAVATYFVTIGSGCKSTPTKSAPATDSTTLTADAGTFTRNTLLTEMGKCAVDTYRRTAQKATALGEAARRHEMEASAESLLAVRAAFAETMTEFQRAEAMQVGPFGPKTAPGGEGVRDIVYSWPNTSRCLVDETLVSKGYEAADFSVKGLITARGLAAVEYLLFNDAPANACRDTSVINASGQWQALGASDLAARRAVYARVVAEDVSTRLNALAQKWDPAGGNFLGELSGAGTTSRHYPSEQIALNSFMDALFYIDLEMKDSKVARPLGLLACPGDCANELEAPHSKLGRANLLANLEGFRALFFGCNANGAGLGFDDLLEGVGGGRAAAAVSAAFADVEKAVLAIPDGKLEDELRAKSPAGQALHAALSKLGDVLKTEVVSVLNLELPARVEGDND